MLNRMGQAAVSNIMMYVLAVMVVGFIIIFGYSAIDGFKRNIDQAAYIKFQQDLKSEVKRVSFDYGSSIVKEFLVPEYREICFVTSYETYPYARLLSTRALEDYPLIKDAVGFMSDPGKNAIKKNVFFVDFITEDSYYIGPIKVENDFFCSDVKDGKLKLIIEGRGNHAIIWQAT